MTVYIIAGFLFFGVLYLIGLLVMARRENQQLREDLSSTVPFRESQFATPHVPESWKFSGSDLNDPREDRPRDTSPE